MPWKDDIGVSVMRELANAHSHHTPSRKLSVPPMKTRSLTPTWYFLVAAIPYSSMPR